MTTMQFLTLLLSLLEQVLAGTTSYTDLQKVVDDAIVNDELPEDISKELLNSIYGLQTDLELIAEHQSTYVGTDSMYSHDDIVGKLEKYGRLLKK